MGSPRAAQTVNDNVKKRLTINPFPNATASLRNLSMFAAAGNDRTGIGGLLHDSPPPLASPPGQGMRRYPLRQQCDVSGQLMAQDLKIAPPRRHTPSSEARFPSARWALTELVPGDVRQSPARKSSRRNSPDQVSRRARPRKDHRQSGVTANASAGSGPTPRASAVGPVVVAPARTWRDCPFRAPCDKNRVSRRAGSVNCDQIVCRIGVGLE